MDAATKTVQSGDFQNSTACPADRVGVVTLWEWPDPMEQLTVADLIAAQKAVSAGGPWRKDIQAKDWVGKPIAQALGLDIDSKADVTKIKGALKIWTDNGMFKEREGQDDKRNKRTFIEVGVWATEGKTTVTWSSRKTKNKAKNKPTKVQVCSCGCVNSPDTPKCMECGAPLGQPATSEFQPVVVGKAPEGIACVQCQTFTDRPVLKIKDGRVPHGQPGGGAECLHWQCAQKWFTGQFQ
jgi:hypothetical protein